MSVWSKYECKGQLSIFDFIDCDVPVSNIERQTEIENKVVERVYNWTIRYCKGWENLPEKERIDQAIKANNHSGGGTTGYIWNCNTKGIDITFDEPIGKCTAVHIGWPMFDRRVYKKECKFSGHECNRQELWKVADTLDDIDCIKVCCRQCGIKLCGARCNGSEEVNA